MNFVLNLIGLLIFILICSHWFLLNFILPSGIMNCDVPHNFTWLFRWVYVFVFTSLSSQESFESHLCHRGFLKENVSLGQFFNVQWGEGSTFSQEKVFVFYNKSCPLALANLSDILEDVCTLLWQFFGFWFLVFFCVWPLSVRCGSSLPCRNALMSILGLCCHVFLFVFWEARDFRWHP